MSHQDNDPMRIVCKLMTQNFFQRGQNYKGLDPRGMCIIQVDSALFLWIGSELPQSNQDAYMTAA